MKIKPRKIIFIVLGVISLFSVVFIILSLNRSSRNKEVSPGEPKLTQEYKGQYSITLSLKESQFQYVDRLPFLQISPFTFSKEHIIQIAQSIGFAGDPITLQDATEGTTYFWKSNNSTIFAYSNSKKIRYESGSSLGTVDKKLTDEEIMAIAQNFLINNNIFSTDNIQTKKVDYLTASSLNEGFVKTSKENALLFQVNIFPKAVNYEIISPVSVKNNSYVQITKDGSVYSSQVILFDKIQNGTTLYPIKNYTQINDSLNKSVLIEIGGEETPLSELPTNLIKSIDIKAIEIAYLMESLSSINLQPIYKLSGNAIISGRNGDIPVVLYLPAISGN